MNSNNTATQQVNDDAQILNKVVPAWARALNKVYNVTFAPLDRFVDWLSGAGTRRMINAFEEQEARKSKVS